MTVEIKTGVDLTRTIELCDRLLPFSGRLTLTNKSYYGIVLSMTVYLRDATE